MALGGCRSIKTPNNQPRVGGSGRGDVIAPGRPRSIVWGGEWNDKKINNIKCILLVQFLNLPYHQSTTYISIYCLGTHNPQHTTQNNQNGPLQPYPPAALPSLSVSRAAVPTTHGASAPHGPMQGARHRVRRRRCLFPCLGAPMQAPSNNRERGGPWH